MLQCLWRDCPVGFVRTDLASHVMSHAAKSESPGASLACQWRGCQRAEKPFAYRYQLLQHAVLHANELQFACQHCPKRFNAEAYLRRHLESHQLPEERRHACSNCGKRFAHSADKSRCERGHRGELHSCRHCGKTFKDPGNLRKHRKRWHAEEQVESGKICNSTLTASAPPPATLVTAASLHRTIDLADMPPQFSETATVQPLPPPPPPAPAPQTVVYSSCVLPPISSFTLSKDGALDLTLGMPDGFNLVDGSYLNGERSQPVCGALDLTQSAHCDASLCCDFDQLCPDLEAGPGRPVDLSLPRLEYYS